MTGVFFLVGVVAFVVVAYWAYTNDRLQTGSGERGLLAMKSDGEASSGRPAPRWRRSLVADRLAADHRQLRRRRDRLQLPPLRPTD
jgi:hypothetical protein